MGSAATDKMDAPLPACMPLDIGQKGKTNKQWNELPSSAWINPKCVKTAMGLEEQVAF